MKGGLGYLRVQPRPLIDPLPLIGILLGILICRLFNGGGVNSWVYGRVILEFGVERLQEVFACKDVLDLHQLPLGLTNSSWSSDCVFRSSISGHHVGPDFREVPGDSIWMPT